MRKRRRLANKMTIMVCAVLIAVSAFFYAPMYVEASSSSFSGVLEPYYAMNGSLNNFYFGNGFGSDFNDDVFYKVNYDFSFNLSLNYVSYLRSLLIRFDKSVIFNEQKVSGSVIDNLERSFTDYIIAKGSTLKNSRFWFQFRVIHDDGQSEATQYDFSYNCDITSITPLTGEESESYQNGYSAGYSAGEQVGESNGYSSGYSDGFEAGEQSGYDSGFQAGKDSVDTQSFYDAGYQAGYDAGYQAGYDTGYDEGYDVGWSAYEAKMDKWGADTSEYPKQIYSIDMGHTFSTNVTYSVPFLYRDSVKGYLSNVQLNPNHTFRFDVKIRPYDWDSADTITYENDFYFCIGGIDYPLSYFSGESTLTSLFVPGDRMSDSYYLVWSTTRASVDGTNNICRVVCPYTITLYDMGPSGDTQNHIANQTDQLSNGYDDSKGNQVNSDLSTGLNDFETAENSLFAIATTGMKDFTFFDFESVPAMITGMSFIGSIMGSWFNQAGGASGVGIVLSILFSVILVAMVLGLYRWYQSRGGKN